MKIYMVGGAVRDELLGRKSNDVDFSVVLEPADMHLSVETPFNTMRARLMQMGFKIFLETPEHLTIRAQFPKGYFKHSLDAARSMSKDKPMTADFVLARKEGTYTDGRRPDSVEIGTLEDDIRRRDFTMNALAKDAHGNIVDMVGGQQDIRDRVIRAVGNPMDRLTEDALRAVRAVRFAVTLGFRIDKELEFAMRTTAVLDAVHENISDERIAVEVSKMMRYDTVQSMILMTHQFPALTGAMFAGRVSLDADLKTKGRNK